MDTTVLEVTEDAIVLAQGLIAGGGLPSQARIDALHVELKGRCSFSEEYQDKRGGYSFPRLSKKLRHILKPYRLIASEARGLEGAADREAV